MSGKHVLMNPWLLFTPAWSCAQKTFPSLGDGRPLALAWHCGVNSNRVPNRESPK